MTRPVVNASDHSVRALLMCAAPQSTQSHSTHLGQRHYERDDVVRAPLQQRVACRTRAWVRSVRHHTRSTRTQHTTRTYVREREHGRAALQRRKPRTAVVTTEV
jgi:hypothetical protein